jgi:hypothetical protein
MNLAFDGNEYRIDHNQLLQVKAKRLYRAYLCLRQVPKCGLGIPISGLLQPKNQLHV